jgi:deoxyribonuclease V
MDGSPRRAHALFAAVDVAYLASGVARAAAVLARDPAFTDIAGERTALLPAAAPYRPGEFFLRELPPIKAVLAGVAGLAMLVVDGYADLDPSGRPGLGAHAHADLAVPVIGIAKTRFATATHAAPLLRGQSGQPVYITAAGLPLADAVSIVRAMQGPFRLPDAVRRADALARAGAELR